MLEILVFNVHKCLTDQFFYHSLPKHKHNIYIDIKFSIRYVCKLSHAWKSNTINKVL